MKIIAVGWNYKSHNEEMSQREQPQYPTIFLKPESALLKDGKPFFLPVFSRQIEYEAELVVRISRLGKNIAPRFAHRYYQDITVGIDFTARDLQTRFREAGAPWDLSKGFDGSAVIGEFIPLDGETAIAHTAFSLQIDGKTVQQGNTADLIFPVDEIIAYVSQFYTLKIGDLIYTGTPAGVGPVQIGNHLQGFIGDREVLNFHVK